MQIFKKILTVTSLFACITAVQAEAQCFCPPDCPSLYLAPVENSCITFQADLLYWRAEEDNMELGVRTDGWVPISVLAPTPVNTEVFITNDHLSSPKSKYKPGFRLSLGFGELGAGWDGAVRWTNFSSTSRVSVDAKATQLPLINAIDFPSSGFFSEWERFGPLDQGGVYKAHWGLSLNLLDIEWGRKSRLSGRSCIRPFLGVRLLRIDQNYRVNEKLGSQLSQPTSISVLTAYGKSKARNDFVGVGPRVGVDIDFHIGCGWEIFGQAAGSLAYGTEKLNSSEDLVVVGSSPQPIRAGATDNALYHMHSKIRRMRWNADLALGLRWSQCMESCGRVYPVAVALSWEEHIFSQANQFRFDGASNQGLDLQRSHKSGYLTTSGWALSAFVGF